MGKKEHVKELKQGAGAWNAWRLRGKNFDVLPNLRGLDLSKANLREAVLVEANLRGATLRKASLRGADLTFTTLVQTDLTDANLTGCRIYGIAAWGLKL